MQIFTDIQTAQCPGPTVLTIGNFDGIHLGHQALLELLQRTARNHSSPDAVTALVTFDPHPLKVLRPDLPLSLLTTPRERMQIAAGLGIDIGVIQPFTRELAVMEAHEFIALLKERLGMAALVVGPDFALGRNRSGTLDVLAELGKQMGYQLIVQEHISWGDQSVRSKTIRQMIIAGDVRAAAVLLGRPYHMIGEVQHGDQRGKQIGIPTANLDAPEDKLWPADGVYATRAWVMDRDRPSAYQSVTNIGYRPTVNGRSRRIETHLLDFPPPDQSGDLYDRRLVIEFIDRLRDEQRFPSLGDLVGQIRADIDRARELLGHAPVDEDPFFVTSQR